MRQRPRELISPTPPDRQDGCTCGMRSGLGLPFTCPVHEPDAHRLEREEADLLRQTDDARAARAAEQRRYALEAELASLNPVAKSGQESPAVPADTVENVKAERARRRANGEPYGYDALADVFMVDASTIRRRLGKLK